MTTSGGTRTSFCVWSWPSRTLKAGRRWVAGLLALAYPSECVACGRDIPDGGVLCAACVASLEPLGGRRCAVCSEPLDDASLDLCLPCGTRDRGFDSLRALGTYDGGWGQLVRVLKFEQEAAVGRWLADRLAEAALELRLEVDVVTFVPMTREERAARGSNQARALARGAATRLGLPVRRVVRKVRRTRRQSGLSARERRWNLRDAFLALPSRGARVLLIDDICTTGSTAEACAAALRRAGARSVDILVVARA